MKLSPELDGVDFELLNKTSELILIQHLARYLLFLIVIISKDLILYLKRFEEVVWQAYEEYEPYNIVQYLFQLV